MRAKSLAQVVAEKPFTDFGEWWPMGRAFLDFMAESIVTEWTNLPGNSGELAAVNLYVTEYIRTVFQRAVRGGLVDDFVHQDHGQPIQSGEFDALSYAFYRSAFALIEQQIDQYAQPLAQDRRLFTKRVGKRFYSQLHEHLDLQLPSGLTTQAQFDQLQQGIAAVGDFLSVQGYLRDHFRFTFDVDVEAGGARIQQTTAELLPNLRNNNLAHALYEMGYPVILPSAVYLYHTIGEAQHHSSRTIEELFDRVGYVARETDDFDPINYPSDMVVELWEIRQ